MPTAAQIAQVRKASFSYGMLQIVQTYAPLFTALDFRTTNQYSFLSLALTKLAKEGVFADYGEGFESADAEMELREFSPALIGGLVKAEMLTMQRYNNERGPEQPEYFALQVATKSQNTILNVEKQMVRGKTFGGDAKGFPGLRDMTPFSGGVFTMSETPDEYDYERSVLNVAGTTANTATSVYSLVSGPMDVQGVICGDNGSGEIMHPTTEPRVENKTVSGQKSLDYMIQQWSGHIGLSVGAMNQQIEGQTVPTQYSARRAANITADSGKTCTDEVIEQLIRSHGVGKVPNLLVMTYRSQKQLQAARTSVRVFNMGPGSARDNTAPVNPGLPTDWDGIPIAVPQTSVLDNKEAIES